MIGQDSVFLNYIYFRGTNFNVHLFRVICENKMFDKKG